MLANLVNNLHAESMTEKRKSPELAAFLADSSYEERVGALHAYAQGSASELASDAKDAREALHLGTPADVIALASLDVETYAKAAAARLRPDEPEPPKPA